MDRLFGILQNVNFQISVLALLTIYVLFSFGLCADRYFIHPDAYYYIGISNLLTEGKIPFIDFSLGYTPLSFYLMYIPLKLLGMSFDNAIIILYTIHFVNAFILYAIFRQQKVSLKWAWFGSLLFLMNCFVFEGLFYVLEPFVLLFGLSALYLVQKKSSNSNLFVVGLLCACSFLCKQYGLGFLFLTIVYVLVQRDYSKPCFKDSGYIVCGFASGLIIFVILMMLQGVESVQMLSLSGADYEKNGLKDFLLAWVYILKRVAPFYLALFFAIWKYKRVFKDSFWLVCICGSFGFMLPCLVRFYVHYLLLALPFIVSLTIYTINQIHNSSIRSFFILILLISTIRPVYYIAKTDRDLLYHDYRSEQKQLSSQIAKYIPKGENNVFASSRALPVSLLNIYEPPLINKYGMSNGFVTSPESVLDMLRSADYAIITQTDLEAQKSRYIAPVINYLRSAFTCHLISCKEIQYNVYVRKNKD